MRNCTVLPLASASVLRCPLKSIGRLPISSPSWIGLTFETILCACRNVLNALPSYIENLASAELLEIVESSHREKALLA